MAVTILNLLSWILEVYWYVLLARIILSYFPDAQRSSFGRYLYTITEPYFGLFRRMIPMVSLGGAYIDLSSIVALIAYTFIRSGLLAVVIWLFNAIGLG
ncbi:YggT family protein [Ferroacidibacillus organovorans]|uniref:YggT family protein n=1 Tax=Ferroacidibacillus organovorans TaxID=1765683 RepID=A0A162UKL9_9BACL|nr:YggT family protein [Ferroacidibacillus organovorans]KYP81831.1 hypothetical protein AYJ22_05570 [Ferroacidibacillus organovorans]OAG94177.1 hypothetical protein AYW79_06600 [Ferroacidibacillus organovorans]OPG16207.1 YggT family protein [Ferroacidibacillus organovorans]